MNVLIINGNPQLESLAGEILNICQKGMQKKHQVKIINLAQEQFMPSLKYGYKKIMQEDQAKITTFQTEVLWAQHIIFIYPLWWGNMPAVLKGFIERTFAPGITYNMRGENRHKLKGKTADIIYTSSSSKIFGIHWRNTPSANLKRNLFFELALKLTVCLA